MDISLTRGRAELVTDDRETLRERLERVTGEQIAALEVIEPAREPSPVPEKVAGFEDGRVADGIDCESLTPALEHKKAREAPGLEL